MNNFLEEFLNNFKFEELINEIFKFKFSLFNFQSLPYQLKFIINYTSSTNIIFFLIVFFFLFFLVRIFLKVVQHILNLIVTFWLTILVFYFLIRTGLADEFFKLFQRFF